MNCTFHKAMSRDAVVRLLLGLNGAAVILFYLVTLIYRRHVIRWLDPAIGPRNRPQPALLACGQACCLMLNGGLQIVAACTRSPYLSAAVAWLGLQSLAHCVVLLLALVRFKVICVYSCSELAFHLLITTTLTWAACQGATIDASQENALQPPLISKTSSLAMKVSSFCYGAGGLALVLTPNWVLRPGPRGSSQFALDLMQSTKLGLLTSTEAWVFWVLGLSPTARSNRAVMAAVAARHAAGLFLALMQRLGRAPEGGLTIWGVLAQLMPCVTCLAALGVMQEHRRRRASATRN